MPHHRIVSPPSAPQHQLLPAACAPVSSDRELLFLCLSLRDEETINAHQRLALLPLPPSLGT
uniref:Uncharacterized protein n=1 Tax=Leersia perrieri TaxID=77586 RepID=A0A0D9XYA4_9ORYZ